MPCLQTSPFPSSPTARASPAYRPYWRCLYVCTELVLTPPTPTQCALTKAAHTSTHNKSMNTHTNTRTRTQSKCHADKASVSAPPQPHKISLAKGDGSTNWYLVPFHHPSNNCLGPRGQIRIILVYIGAKISHEGTKKEEKKITWLTVSLPSFFLGLVFPVMPQRRDTLKAEMHQNKRAQEKKRKRLFLFHIHVAKNSPHTASDSSGHEKLLIMTKKFSHDYFFFSLSLNCLVTTERGFSSSI